MTKTVGVIPDVGTNSGPTPVHQLLQDIVQPEMRDQICNQCMKLGHKLTPHMRFRVVPRIANVMGIEIDRTRAPAFSVLIEEKIDFCKVFG